MEMLLAHISSRAPCRRKLPLFSAVVFVELLFVIYKVSTAPFFFWSGVFALTFLLFSLSKNDFVLAVLALIPSVLLMKYNNSGAAVLSYCILFVELKWLLFSGSWPNIKSFWPLFFLTLCVLATVAFHADLSLLFAFSRFAVSIVFLFSLINDKNALLAVRKQGVGFFIFGVTLNVLLGVAFYILEGKTLLDGLFSGVSIDRNYFSSAVSVAISFLVVRLFLHRPTPGDLFELSVLLIGGLLSGSRTFFVSLLIPGLSIVGFAMTRQYRKKATRVLLLMLIFAVVSIIALYPLIAPIIERFKSADVFTGNGRYQAWGFYLAETANNPVSFLFGNSSRLNLYVSFNEAGVATHSVVQHNTFIESFSEIGLLGSLSLLVTFFSMNRAVSMRGFSFLCLAPLASLFLCYFFINGLFSDFLTFVFFLCITFSKKEVLCIKGAEK